MSVRVTPNPNAFPRLRTMAEALKITDGDFAGPVMTVVGNVHRRQQKQIFATQGAAGLSGPWEPLSPAYAKRKKRQGYGSKILLRAGSMRAALTTASSPAYHQSFQKVGPLAVYLLGALSRVAGYHRKGYANRKRGGRLPRREMLNKTVAQIAEIKNAIVEWYRTKRIPQVLRHRGAR